MWMVPDPGVGVLLPLCCPLSREGAWRLEAAQAWVWAFGCVPSHGRGWTPNCRGGSRNTSLQDVWAGMECQRENRETEYRDRSGQK